jgi:hypothetical protein
MDFIFLTTKRSVSNSNNKDCKISALLFKDISQGIAMSPLGEVLISIIRMPKIYENMVLKDFIEYFWDNIRLEN